MACSLLSVPKIDGRLDRELIHSACNEHVFSLHAVLLSSRVNCFFNACRGAIFNSFSGRTMT